MLQKRESSVTGGVSDPRRQKKEYIRFLKGLYVFKCTKHALVKASAFSYILSSYFCFNQWFLEFSGQDFLRYTDILG